jgi:DNA-directed RNA polymerase subunit RPC12/RpoP
MTIILIEGEPGEFRYTCVECGGEFKSALTGEEGRRFRLQCADV